jgi:hypothetical protein
MNTAASSAPTSEDAAAIEAVLRRYMALFNAGDAEPIATEVYKAPVLLLWPTGAHAAFPDTDALSKFFRGYIDGEVKSGRIATEIEKLEICRLSQSVALAFVDYAITRVDGNVKSGWFYMFLKEAGAWRATSLAPRDLRTKVICQGIM